MTFKVNLVHTVSWEPASAAEQDHIETKQTNKKNAPPKTQTKKTKGNNKQINKTKTFKVTASLVFSSVSFRVWGSYLPIFDFSFLWLWRLNLETPIG